MSLSCLATKVEVLSVAAVRQSVCTVPVAQKRYVKSHDLVLLWNTNRKLVLEVETPVNMAAWPS